MMVQGCRKITFSCQVDPFMPKCGSLFPPFFCRFFIECDALEFFFSTDRCGVGEHYASVLPFLRWVVSSQPRGPHSSASLPSSLGACLRAVCQCTRKLQTQCYGQAGFQGVWPTPPPGWVDAFPQTTKIGRISVRFNFERSRAFGHGPVHGGVLAVSKALFWGLPSWAGRFKTPISPPPEATQPNSG